MAEPQRLPEEFSLFPPPEQLCARFALTPREAEAAVLMAQGLSDRTIASRLGVSHHTARRYAERVLGKIGVHSRAAVAFHILWDTRGTDGSPGPGTPVTG